MIIAKCSGAFQEHHQWKDPHVMKKQKPASLLLLLLLCGFHFGEAQGQPKSIVFSEQKTLEDARTKYLLDGVMFSSQIGTPTVIRDPFNREQFQLCAVNQRDTGILGIKGTACEDVFISFIKVTDKAEPRVKRYVKDIVIKVQAFGGVIAFWRDKEGTVHKQVQFPTLPLGEAVFNIAGETTGVELESENLECTACNFSVLGLSFFDTKGADALCSPTTDAGLSHYRLLNEDYPQSVYDILDSYRVGRNTILPLRFQPLDQSKPTYIDEFAIFVRMPTDKSLTAQDIFKDMRRRLDSVGIGMANWKFTNIGEFSYFDLKKILARPDKQPGVGDIFQVNIFGPENGDVMMTDLKESPDNSYFRYSTLNNNLPKGNAAHPNNGSREYGYESALDGTVKFYVRGVDQFRLGLNAYVGGGNLQERFWTRFLEGIGARVEEAGGKVVLKTAKSVDDKINTLPPCYKSQRRGYGVEVKAAPVPRR